MIKRGAMQWTEKALDILPETAKVAALIRHGEKEKKRPQLSDDFRLLTENGKTESAVMGQLFRGRLAPVCYSPVLRCGQTAECIAAGGGAKIGECFLRLSGNPDFLPSRRGMREGKQKEGFISLIDKVACEGYPGFNHAPAAAAKMCAWLLSRSVCGINIHVSHDWVVHLLAFAAGAKTASFAEEKVEYLDALFLWKSNGVAHFYYRGRGGVCSDVFCRMLGTESS